MQRKKAASKQASFALEALTWVAGKDKVSVRGSLRDHRQGQYVPAVAGLLDRRRVLELDNGDVDLLDIRPIEVVGADTLKRRGLRARNYEIIGLDLIEDVSGRDQK